MTREEAIKGLKVLRKDFSGYKPNEEMFDMAIEALSENKRTDKRTETHACDLIKRQDAIDKVEEWIETYNSGRGGKRERDAIKRVISGIKKLPSADRPKGEWIPIKWHTITEEEREREGYPKEWVTYLDCEMPADNESILVQTHGGYICEDVCYADGQYSLDSGYDWIEDIVAWMPLPSPWKGDE